MGYRDMVEADATDTELRAYLTDSDPVAVTVRIPESLKDAAQEHARLHGMSFSAFVRACLIDGLMDEEGR